MIEVINLSKRFSDKTLFDNTNLKFLNGNTYGIIGANGAGKSTFLKILVSEIEPSEGQVIIGKNARVSVLEQNQNAYQDEPALNVVIMGNKELYSIQVERDAIYANVNATEKDYERAADLEERFGARGGWSAENDAQILLNELDVAPSNWNLPMRELKAADKVKVLLARALFGNPEVLIMDEPTNHLDLKTIKWLERFLATYDNTAIVVSHDSDFLDEVCTHIVDIDFGGAKMFTGNYSFWKQSSELALELMQKTNVKAEEKRKKLQEFIARFSANASKSSQATSRKKALEKIELEDIKPSNRKYPFIRFDLNRDPGKEILKVENLSYQNADGEVLFSNVSFSLHRGEKLALLGQNDIAKTRFLEILLLQLKPTTGQVTWGATIKFDYFPSNNDQYFKKADETILDWISKWPLDNSTEVTKDNSDQRMRSFLGRMLFSGDAVFKKASVASGGEKARLMFSRMMLRESNFLLFDQPLDHLDTESIDAVIESVRNYKSSVIFTTFNRAFIRECANTILELKPTNNVFFRGSLAEFEAKMNY